MIEKQVRSIESLEKTYFWKTKHFNAETPQSTLFYKKNAWVWDGKFFKNTWIHPKSSKIKIFNQFVLKAQTLNTFCIKMLCFSKIWFFQTFDQSNLFFDQSKLRLKFLVWVCLTRLMFHRFLINRNWKIFSFYVFDQKFFSCIICV